jgi:hypothetical protein
MTEEEKEEEEGKIPPAWAGIPLQDYFDKGFKPYKRTDRRYPGKAWITLKRGRFEKSLGPYSEERWNLITSMYGRRELPGFRTPYLPKRSSSRGDLLSVSLAPPPSLPRQMGINTRTLMYYEWAKMKGFDGTLGDFLNDVCYAYFLEHGIEPVIVVTEKGEEGENVRD